MLLSAAILTPSAPSPLTTRLSTLGAVRLRLMVRAPRGKCPPGATSKSLAPFSLAPLSLRRRVRPELRIRRDGQRDKNRRSLFLLAVNPDPAFVGLDDHFADHKPQAGSILRPIFGVRCLFVFFEQVADLFFGNSNAGIPHPEVHTSTVHRHGPHFDLPALGRHLAGVHY